MVSGRVASRIRRRGRFCGRRRVRVVRLSASMSEKESMTVMEEKRNRDNVKQQKIASTEMEDFKAMPP